MAPPSAASYSSRGSRSSKTYRFFMGPTEPEYQRWATRQRMWDWLISLPESVPWNVFICIMTLVIVLIISLDLVFPIVLYDPFYALHCIALFCNDINKIKYEYYTFKASDILGYLMDLLSFTPLIISMTFFMDTYTVYISNMVFNMMRLHRPFRYLWDLNDYNLNWSVLGTLLKYIYILSFLRILFANLLIWFRLGTKARYVSPPAWLKSKQTKRFFRSLYVIFKLFVPMGSDTYPNSDLSRGVVTAIAILSNLLVTGITVASLSLMISLKMRPEETFRARFRLIMNEMTQTQVPYHVAEKVETFYRIFWYKQKAVSEPSLIKIFPHILVSDIRTNIYFEAQLKTRMLSDLPYVFLSQIAKYMHTIHYIPGDTIIKRNTITPSIIYISYGDVEMVTPEDDETATMRFTRGTILNPCGAAVERAITRAHVTVRAATFCSAHVLNFADLWRAVFKCGNMVGQRFILHFSFADHLDKVKRHYLFRDHPPVLYKSTILMLKNNLTDLKEARDSKGELLMKRSDFFIVISGCYSMRNRTDTSLMDETDPICLRSRFPCILQPHSSFLLTWNILVACLAILSAFLRPYNTVYLANSSMEYLFFHNIVLIVFILDIIVRLSTGSKIEEGTPISLTQIASEQMRNYWFVLDVLSVVINLPLVEVLFKLPRVFKLLKHLEDIWVYQSSALRFLSYCLLMMLMCYIIASSQQYFMCNTGYCVVNNFTHEPFWEQMPIDNGPVEGRLLYSLYWSISLISKTTHKTAQTTRLLWLHQIYVMFFIEVFTVLHLLVEATYSATIMVSETLRYEYTTCIETVKKFLVKHAMDTVIQHRFISYLQLCWFTDKAYSITNDKASIWFDLPAHVYQDILTIQRSKYILGIPFMKYLSNIQLKDVSSKACLFYTSPKEILLNTGDISNEIYVIKRGLCEIVDPITKNVVTIIGSKCHFGDIECLLRLPSYYTVRAVTHVQLFKISKKHLKQVMEIPKLKDAIHYAKQQAEYKLLQKPEQPFLSYEMPQAPTNRATFPLPRKHESDSAFLFPFSRLGILSNLRYVFPRFTIRPDGVYLKRYEWFRAACALMSANIFPLYSFLMLQWPFMAHITTFLDLSAFYDILQRMLVAYYNEQGILVYHPASTAAHYLRGAFIVDVMGCIALESVDSARSFLYYKNGAYKHPSSLQYLMYNRVIQLYRVPGALEILKDYIDRQDIILIIKALPLFMALLIISTSVMLEISVDEWLLEKGGWILEPIPINKSWIDIFGRAVRYNITETPWNSVLTTFYWIVYEATTTGYNLFQPTERHQIYVLVTCMMIGKLLTTFFTVRIISIRSNVNRALAEYQKHMSDVVSFMKREKLDQELQREVILYYEYMWDQTGGTEYRSVLKLCNQITLRTDAILHIYGVTFSMCPILHGCDKSLIRVVGRAVHSTYFLKSMTIIECQDVITEMYLVQSGIVEVHYDYNGTKLVVKLHRGSVFGNLESSKTTVCPNKFVALSNVHLLKIKSEGFYSIIQDFPSVKTLIKKFRSQSEHFIRGITNEEDEDDLVLHREGSKLRFSGLRQKIFKFLRTHSKGVQIYLIVVSMLCVYGDVYISSFQDNSPKFIATLYLLDLCFYIKIVMNYYVPDVTKEEMLTRKALETSWKKYYATEFKYDIFSCIPFEILSIFRTNPWTLFGVLRLNRVLRVVTVYRCLSRYYEKLSINLSITTMSTVFIWFTLFIHSTSCLWHLLGVRNERYHPKSSWQYTDNGTSLCRNNYTCALYFVLTTFTQNGIGDIVPRQVSEVAFVCVLMIVSTMLYIIYVGEFSNIIQYQYFRHFAFFSKYLELKVFLENNRVSKNLSLLTHNYTLFLWRESRGLQMPHFLVNAPECLRLKIMSAAFMHHLTAHPIFKECEPAFLRQLVGRFELFFYDKNMFVVKEGEITNAMYFIHKGRVDEMDQDFGDSYEVLNAGQCFGSMNGLKHDEEFSYSYKTVFKSQILILPLSEWEHLLKHFPKSKQIIFKKFEPETPLPQYYSVDETNKFKRKESAGQTTSRKSQYFPTKRRPDSTSTDVESAKSSKRTSLKSAESTQGLHLRPPTQTLEKMREKSHLTFEKLKEQQLAHQSELQRLNASRLFIKDLITQMRQQSSLRTGQLDVVSTDSENTSSSRSLENPDKSYGKDRSHVNFEIDEKPSTSAGYAPKLFNAPSKSALKNIDMRDRSNASSGTSIKISEESNRTYSVENIEMTNMLKDKKSIEEDKRLELQKTTDEEPSEPVEITTKRLALKASSEIIESENSAGSSITFMVEDTMSITSMEHRISLRNFEDDSKRQKAKKPKAHKRADEPSQLSSESLSAGPSERRRSLKHKSSKKRDPHDDDNESPSDVGHTSKSSSSSSKSMEGKYGKKDR